MGRYFLRPLDWRAYDRIPVSTAGGRLGASGLGLGFL